MADITITPAGAAFNPTDTVTSTRLNEARNPTAALVAASIGTADIADDAITPALIAGDAITTPAILDANVTTAKIADANITFAKLTDVIDDDTMATATDTTLATSESIKTYVDGTSNFTTEDGQSAGYQVFPSGLKMAWGSATTSIYPTQGGTVTFPTNATGGTLFDEIPTVQLTYNDEAVNQFATKCKFVTRTNFQNYSQSTTDPGRYLAIGI
jgi:hypothetical protein